MTKPVALSLQPLFHCSDPFVGMEEPAILLATFIGNMNAADTRAFFIDKTGATHPLNQCKNMISHGFTAATLPLPKLSPQRSRHEALEGWRRQGYMVDVLERSLDPPP